MTTHLDYVTGRFVLSEHLVPAGNQQFYHIYDGDFILGETLIPGLGGGGGLFLDASLDLNFAENLSLVDDVSGNDLVTFSRASSGTYVGSDGLIKTSPVNLLTYSNLITSANWTFSRLSAPTSATTEIDSPVSGSSVFKLLETTDTGEHSFRKTSAVPIASSTTVTTSLYINTSLGRSKVRVYGFALNNLTFIWDLVNNAEISLTGGTSATVESTPIGNNWYRLKWTDIATVNNNFKPAIMSVTDSNQFSFAGDTSKGFYITGYQIEEGTTATDYIPTTSTISGAPRFDHDPATGESLGLLIEEARTNYFFDPTSGIVTIGTAPPTKSIITGTLPDGSTGSIVSMSYQAGDSRARWVIAGDGVSTYHFSVYWKLQGDASWNRFDKAVITAPTFAYADVLTSDLGVPSESVVYFGFSQVEAGSFPTSYIPTEGSTVTRAADVAEITGANFANWFNTSEQQGTVFTEVATKGTSGIDAAFAIGSNADNDRWLQQYFYPSSVQYEYEQGLPPAHTYTTGTFIKSAIGRSQGDNAVGLSGSIVQTDSYSGSYSPVFMKIGVSGDANRIFNGHIKRLAYFPVRKTDEELQELTS